MDNIKRGCTDRPVMDIKQDCFNIQKYVDGLCSFIQACETPMTISIQGDWGSGKTSMMNMIKSTIEDSVWNVWFNTWQFSQFDMGSSLAFSMIDVILKELDCEVNVRKKLLNGLIGFGKRIVRNAADYTLGGEITGAITNVLESDSTSDYALEIMELKERFQDAVNKKLTKEHRDRVVIFVDDLDRLQPEKAVELLEVLKMFLDCDNCVFVLAVDYEVVTLGIKQKFGNDVPEEKGRSFFDKIIQLPFKMPVAQYDIKNYIKETLQKMDFKFDDKTVDIYVGLIQTSIGFNPRSMKRLFNTYQLLDIISKNTITGIEDNTRQRVLFGIVCMQMRYESLYKYFVSSSAAIDSEALEIFVDEDAVSKIRNDTELLMLIQDNRHYNKDNLYEEDTQIRNIVSFMKRFLAAIHLDNNESISDDELTVFKTILKCSMVTSVAETQEINDTDDEMEMRHRNYRLGQTVAEKLSEYGKFEKWLPRKARDGIKLSYVSFYQNLTTSHGQQFTLEYHLKNIDNKLTVIIVIRFYLNKKNDEYMDEVFNFFTDNPLSYSKNPTVVRYSKSGGFDYEVLRLDYSDTKVVEKIAYEWEKARREIEKFL